MLLRFIAFGLLLFAPLLQGAVDFNREVRPLLSDRCFACHGPDSAKREAGLRLDTFDGATLKLESGKQAIVPGKSRASELFTRIHETDPQEIMPPPKLNRPLSAAEKDVLVRWVDEGAVYTKHWAFLPTGKHPAPVVRNSAWSKDDLDRFILEKLEPQKLEPNPQADRGTLLRRISFVLTGLPPTPDQLAAFVSDPSPGAYEKQVDALLASPRFGERMALDWLDISRFADTYGYQTDKECFVWPWRDWVINSFNNNLPYDQFLTWQIAGDLLPNATQEQRLATTFNRLHRQTEEGGSIEQEFRQEYVSDRVHTVGTAFLGLTLECCKCHDHKYDPLPQADYYSMNAMFGQIDECGLIPYSIATKAPEPSMRIVKPQQMPELEKRRAALAASQSALQSKSAGRDDAFEQWLATTPSLAPPSPSDHFTLDSIAEGKLPNSVPSAAPGSMSGGNLAAVPGAVNGAMQFDGDTVLQLDGVKNLTRHQPLTVSLRMFTPEKKQRAVLLHTGPAMFSQMADAAGFELLMENGKLRWSCIHLWPGCAVSVESKEDFPVASWVHVTVTYDGSSSAHGLKIYCDGKLVPTAVLHDHLDKGITAQIMRVGARPRDDRGFADGRLDELKIFRQALSPLEVADLNAPTLDASMQSAKAGNAVAKAAVRAYYLDRIDPEIAKARAAVVAARKSLEDDFEDSLPLIMVMKESPTPKQFYVLTRGDYASPDLKRPVEPSPPAAVFPFDPKAPRNRLGLSQWMADPKNPLVSRVAVNRLWMMCFGNGIVATQENFGMQGDAPTHMELLDTLAYDFSHDGWDVKRMLKRILMSATFQQSSASSKTKQEIDPKNQLLSRGPSYRLSAEAIRDQALLASGLLVERLGGPSVKPWQPDGVWSESGASGGDYKADGGEGRYRRSLYTYRKRTAPPPSLLTLDAGSREICQPRRLTTNTPLQPLVFLNDRGLFECAGTLAKRVTQEQPSGPDAQIQLAFLWLTSRQPAARELDILRDLLARQLADFATDKAAAKSICGEENPTLAAMTTLCSTLLTSDAAITNR
ncbi:MAG: DUF1553 domain-containing protein [Akkermansiaceae bacterium]|nr:DUF1553 domain-containing protein [Akkermansiaceae bacterium]